MASLDTNCLLRFALDDIDDQSGAVNRLIAREKNVDVADLAIVEMVFVLEKVYDMPRDLVSANVELIMSHASLNCNRQMLAASLEMYLQCPKLSFNDCCLATYSSLQESEPLYTFDRKLASQAKQAKLLA